MTGYSLDELQNLAKAHAAEQHVISIMQRHMHRPPRPRPAPPVPMAPMTRDTVAQTLLEVSPIAAQLFIAISQAEKDAQGIVRAERAELAALIKKSVSSVTRATAELQDRIHPANEVSSLCATMKIAGDPKIHLERETDANVTKL
jgi:hypothetical protein